MHRPGNRVVIYCFDNEMTVSIGKQESAVVENLLEACGLQGQGSCNIHILFSHRLLQDHDGIPAQPLCLLKPASIHHSPDNLMQRVLSRLVHFSHRKRAELKL